MVTDGPWRPQLCSHNIRRGEYCRDAVAYHLSTASAGRAADWRAVDAPRQALWHALGKPTSDIRHPIRKQPSGNLGALEFEIRTGWRASGRAKKCSIATETQQLRPHNRRHNGHQLRQHQPGPRLGVLPYVFPPNPLLFLERMAHERDSKKGTIWKKIYIRTVGAKKGDRESNGTFRADGMTSFGQLQAAATPSSASASRPAASSSRATR